MISNMDPQLNHDRLDHKIHVTIGELQQKAQLKQQPRLGLYFEKFNVNLEKFAVFVGLKSQFASQFGCSSRIFHC